MNGETSQSPFPTSGESGSSTSSFSSGASGFSADSDTSDTTVRRFAQKVHEAVDTLEQKLGMGSEKVMGLQQEYGDMAREQVRANPLAALGTAFAVGFIFAKLFTGR
ncbi:hypothetical protein [Ramlibacter sp.]|uniref:hypothetical protein n=1 Tax=Ramlibacter sp. TaxID=1917967 RepID=UPI00182F97F5|nr:hypothetical protein [Ramlibacter sp.]MBA2674676.1 hypothetical protein [Ramlibacter sp.]